MEKEKQLVEWIEGLAPWEIFFTGTTYYAASNASLQRTFEGFMKRNYPKVSYVYTLEPHSAEGFHVHSLFDEGHDIRWKDFWSKWFKRYGRNRTEPIAHKADVENYVTKYICKTHEQKHRNKNAEIWWNVHLSQYRKRMKRIVNNGSSQRTGTRREELWPKDTGLQMGFG